MKYKKFSDPYETFAKFNCTCSACSCKIRKGDKIVYDKMRSLVYCDSCPAGRQVMEGTRAAISYDNYGTDIY